MRLANRFGIGVVMLGVGLLVQACTGDTHPKDEVVRVRTDDPKLSAAKSSARAGLDRFFTRLQNPAPSESGFGLKYDLNYGTSGRVEPEIIWARDVQMKGGDIYGFLDNTPVTPGFKADQLVKIDRASIADWAIKVGDKFEGHYTTRVLVKSMKESEAAQVLARLHPLQ